MSEEKKRPSWYADDFETTTDLDGEAEDYPVGKADRDALVDLEPGGTHLIVRGGDTITFRREYDNTLSATKRSGRVRVWAWAIRDVETGETWRGNNIADYVDKAAELGGIHWFHNLRFDGAFLDAYLCDEEPHGLAMTPGSWKKRSVPVASFGSLISDSGAHYARYVHLADGRRFEVRDSLKKFPNASIDDLAKMYESDIPKGEIDYHASRPEGYEPTDEEWEYVEADVAILAKALGVARDLGNESITIGADVMAEYRGTMRGGRFRTVFPILDRDLDEWLRRAYRGGWTYVNPTYQGQILNKKGSVWDVNSMYPYVMRNRSFPVGEPVRLAPGQTSLEGYPHVIYGALIDATIKPGKFPMLQVKNDARYPTTKYLEYAEGVEWYGTEIDWKLLHEQYDVEIYEWIAGYAFRGETDLFDRYIDKWADIKENSTGGLRQQAKYQLNNLWGKFGVNPLRAGRVPKVGEHGEPSYSVTAHEYGDPCYTPVAIYTTSYARDLIVRAAQSFGTKFLAADTDSCHILGTDPGELDVHETRLGAWKREAVFDKATYLRPKAYAERILREGQESKVVARVSGLPRKLLEGADIESVRIGSKFKGKLVPKRVRGGIILVSSEFEIGNGEEWSIGR